MDSISNSYILKIIPHYMPITTNQNFSIWSVSKAYIQNSKFSNNFLIISFKNSDSKLLDNIIYIEPPKVSNTSHNEWLICNDISRDEYTELVIKKIKEIKPKLIEVENDPRLAGKIAKNIKIPVVFISHVVIAKRNLISRLVQYISYIRHIKEIIFVSNSHKNHFKKSFFYSKKPCTVIHNSYAHINPTNIEFIHKKNQIIFVGRGLKYKGYQEYILGVIPILLKYQNWKAIACISVESQDINNEIDEFISQSNVQNFIKSNRLKILKNVPNKIIFQHLEESKIAVTPTHSNFIEGLPLVGLEALAAKCAYIVPPNPGFKELCENNALYLDSISPNNITQKLIYFINNPDIMENYALSGYKHVISNYNVKDLVKLYDKIREKYLK